MTNAQPYYRVILSEANAAQIGVFVAIWSQIELFLVDCTAKMLGISQAPAIILTDGTTAGPKFALFCKLAKLRIKDAETLAALAEFRKEIGFLLEKRNHMMHGTWGLWVSDDYKREVAGAWYPKGVKRELLIDELSDLIFRASKQTHNIVKIRQHLYGQSWDWKAENPPTFRFSKSEPNRPIGETERINIGALLRADDIAGI